MQKGRVTRTAVIGLVVALCTAVEAAAASASIKVTVEAPLNVRYCPSTTTSPFYDNATCYVMYGLGSGARVTVDQECMQGQKVNGDPKWDHLASGGWISDWFTAGDSYGFDSGKGLIDGCHWPTFS
jgi:hypothetical protein